MRPKRSTHVSCENRSSVLESLERRHLLATLFVTGGNGNDLISLAVGSGVITVEINGGTGTFNDSDFSDIVVNANAGADKIDLHSNGTNAVVLNGGAGIDAFIIADGDLDSNLQTDLIINGGSEHDTISFDDSLDGVGSDTYTISADRFTKGARDFGHGGVELIRLIGSPQPDTINLNGTTANLDLSFGAGNDVAIVGGGDFDSNIVGDVVLRGQADFDTLKFDDTADGPGADSWTVTSSLFYKDVGGELTYSTFETLQLDASTHEDLILIRSVASGVPLTVNGGDQHDVFEVGSPIDGVDRILGILNLDGQLGADTLNYNDEAHSVDATYRLTNNDLLRVGVANTNPFGMELIQVFGGTGNNTFETYSIAAGTNVLLYGHDGDDTYEVGAPGAGDWDRFLLGYLDIQPFLSVEGFDVVHINDLADQGADDYEVTQTTTTKTSIATGISYRGINEYVLNANNDANTITSDGPGDLYRLNGNGGADTFMIKDTRGSPIVIDGGDGLDTVNVNPDEQIFGAAVQFDNTQDLAALHLFADGEARVNSGADKVLYTQSLTIDAGAGPLDLADNDMIVDYVAPLTPLATIQSHVASGYAGGNWNGPGIVSSAAGVASNTALGLAHSNEIFSAFPATFSGVSVDSSAVLVKYTYTGDSNLDGAVNLSDFNRLVANFGAAPRRWIHGNSDYDLDVDLADFNGLVTNFGSVALAPDGDDDQPLI